MPQDDLNRLTIEKKAYSPSRSGRRKWRYRIVALLAVVLLVAAAWSWYARRSVEVEVATVSLVYPSQTISLLNASGYVVAQRKAAVSSKATGRLMWLGVEEGSVVKEGELLARLENRDVEAEKDRAAANVVAARESLEQAEVEQKDAARNLSRMKQLLFEGIVSQADFDTAQARYRRAASASAEARARIEAARSALEGAQASLDYTLIRAPFDGVVLTKNADEGDIVSPLAAAANAKAAVVTLADMGSLQVEADVSESNLGKVKVGQPCEITLDALPDARFRGELETIVPTADRSKGSVMVKVAFLEKDKRILPEMSAKVAFLERAMQPGEMKPRVAISPSSVARRDGGNFVFLVSGDRVQLTPVRLGSKLGDMVEVLSGIKAGDRIATAPLDELRDGARVKTAEK